MSHVMPAVFIGHDNPMNALQENAYTRGWAAIGRRIPRPKAVLAVSVSAGSEMRSQYVAVPNPVSGRRSDAGGV